MELGEPAVTRDLCRTANADRPRWVVSSAARPLAAGLAAAALLAAAPSASGAPAAPDRFSVTETLFLVVPGQIMKIGRAGPRAVIEQTIPPRADNPTGVRSRAYYDLTAGFSYTLDLIDPATSCGPSKFTGDWGDPFAMSADLIGQMAKFHPTHVGVATVNGIATEVSVAATPDGQAKVWVEPKTGLIVKWVMTAPSGPPRTMIEVTSFSLTPPAAAALALPTKCAKGGEILRARPFTPAADPPPAPQAHRAPASETR